MTAGSELTVRDVMSTDVTVIEYSQTMQQAAHQLRAAEFTAAPVIDAVGRLVGVLSARHFLALEDQHDWTHGSYVLPSDARLEIDELTHKVSIEVNPTDTVDRHMNRDAPTVDQGVTIGQAAAMMRERRLHHLIVVDESNRPTGIVSSLDLLGGFLTMGR